MNRRYRPAPLDVLSGAQPRRYAAPEQVAGRRELVDERSDIYSLGATLFELLVGTGAFRRLLQRQSLNRWVVAVDDPLRLLKTQVPVELEAICARCLATDRSKRYSSAEDLACELHRFLAGTPVFAVQTAGDNDDPSASQEALRYPLLTHGAAVMAGELWMLDSILCCFATMVFTAARVFDVISPWERSHYGLWGVLAVAHAGLAYPLWRLSRSAKSADEDRFSRAARWSFLLGTCFLLACAGTFHPAAADLLGEMVTTVRYIVGAQAGVLMLASLQAYWGMERYSRWASDVRKYKSQRRQLERDALLRASLATLTEHPACASLEKINDRQDHVLVNNRIDVLFLLTSASAKDRHVFDVDSAIADRIFDSIAEDHRRVVVLLGLEGPLAIYEAQEFERVLQPLNDGIQEVTLTKDALTGPALSLRRDRDSEVSFPSAVFDP